MVVVPSTDASRYHSGCIDCGTSPECFGYTLACTWRYFSGIMRWVREAHHLSSSITEVKKRQSCTVTVSHALISWYLISYREYLAFIDAVRQWGVFWYFSLCVLCNGIHKVVAKFVTSSRANVEVVKSLQ
jgi:hypothetical protein